jgi:hypothetical protein
LQLRFPGLGPQAVTLHGIQFAIVGEDAEGLAQAPFRPGIGRKALVIGDERGGEARVAEIGIKNGEIFRQHQALVANDLRGAGHGKKTALVDKAFFYPPSQAIKEAFVAVCVGGVGEAHKGLPYTRQAFEGFVATSGKVGRDLAPAQTSEPKVLGFGIQCRADFTRNRLVSREKKLADTEMSAESDALLNGDSAEKGLRHLQ